MQYNNITIMGKHAWRIAVFLYFYYIRSHLTPKKCVYIYWSQVFYT